MADENMMEMDDSEEEGESLPSGGGKSPIVKYLPVIIGLLVVQVVLAYFVAQWFFAPVDNTAAEPVEAVAAVENTPAPASGSTYQPPPMAVATIFDQLEVTVVNPAGTDGLRFLSTQIALGLSSPDVATFITTNNLIYRIQDVLVRIFSSKTIPDLEASKHDLLKEEIKTKLNDFLGKNAVVEVYIKSFVLQ
jgi:flagellar basal body-associated protein FliL